MNCITKNSFAPKNLQNKADKILQSPVYPEKTTPCIKTDPQNEFISREINNINKFFTPNLINLKKPDSMDLNKLGNLKKLNFLQINAEVAAQEIANLQVITIRNLQQLTGSKSEDLKELSKLGEQVKVNLIRRANNNSSFNCAALALVSIFLCLAKTLGNQASFQDVMQQMMGEINATLIELTSEIQNAFKVGQEDSKARMLADIRGGGILGLLLSSITAIVGEVMIIIGALTILAGGVGAGLIVAGSVLLANASAQIAGNIALIKNPEDALKKNNWESALIQNGVFGLADIAGWRGGGNVLEVTSSIMMLVASDGVSIASSISQRASLTAVQVAARSLAALNSLIQLVGTIGSAACNEEVFQEMSLGLIGLSLGESLKATKMDQNILLMVLKAIICGVGQVGMQSLHNVGEVDISKLEKDAVKAKANLENISKNSTNPNQSDLDKAQKAVEKSIEKIVEANKNESASSNIAGLRSLSSRLSEIYKVNQIKGGISSTSIIASAVAKKDNGEYSAKVRLDKSSFNIIQEQFHEIARILQASVNEAVESEKQTVDLVQEFHQSFQKIFSYQNQHS